MAEESVSGNKYCQIGSGTINKYLQITNPTNNQTYSIFSKSGRELIKNYILQISTGGYEEQTQQPIT